MGMLYREVRAGKLSVDEDALLAELAREDNQFAYQQLWWMANRLPGRPRLCAEALRQIATRGHARGCALEYLRLSDPEKAAEVASAFLADADGHLVFFAAKAILARDPARAAAAWQAALSRPGYWFWCDSIDSFGRDVDWVDDMVDRARSEPSGPWRAILRRLDAQWGFACLDDEPTRSRGVYGVFRWHQATCPGCRRQLFIPEGLDGASLRCLACRHRFVHVAQPPAS